MEDNLEGMIREVRDRMRRTETRVTKVANYLNVESGASKPTFENGRLYLPSRKASIEEALNAVPQSWEADRAIEVYVGQDFLMEVYLTPAG